MKRLALLVAIPVVIASCLSCSPRNRICIADLVAPRTEEASSHTAAPLDLGPALDTPLPLSEYRLRGEPVRVEGVADNLSGIAWSPVTKTLFGVINEPTSIVELSTDGRVLRHIPLRGFWDTEGIAHIDGSRFVVAEERRHTLAVINIDTDTREVMRDEALIISILPELAGTNLGIEGVTWDTAGKRFVCVKESEPTAVYVLRLAADDPEPKAELLCDAQKRNMKVRDLADVFYLNATGHILLLSDESHVVVECDGKGTPVARLPLGTVAGMAQPEGLTMDDSGRIYVVGEPNVFAVFDPPPTE